MEFDVVFGIDSASFSAGVDRLNQDQQSHDALFKGEYHDDTVSASWEVPVGQSPAFEFQPPSAAKWRTSIDADGQNPTGDPPTDNVLILSFPSLRLDATIDGEHMPEVSPPVEFYGQAVLTGGTASLTPLAIWLDESQLSDDDKPSVNGLILPAVFTQLGAVLSGHAITPQTVDVAGTDVEFTATDVLITGSHLIVVAKSDAATAAPVPSTWPTQPVFTIVNRAFALNVAQRTADAHKNLTVYDQPASKNEKASVSGKVVIASLNDITIDPSDATSWSASLDLWFDVSASLLGTKCAVKKSSDSM